MKRNENTPSTTEMLSSLPSVSLDSDSKTALYIQIADQISTFIEKELLLKGSKLPGSRTLSKQLQINRQTVVAAYEELFNQGWVEIRPNQGTFVSGTILRTTAKGLAEITPSYPSKTGFSFEISNLLTSPFEKISGDYIFNDGTPDIFLTQTDELSRLYSANLKRKSNQKKMAYHQSEGSEYFKIQLTQYLRQHRALPIAEQNILITRSFELSLHLLAESLLEYRDTVVVGDPSYFAANMIFQKSGAKIFTIPMQKDGLDTAALQKLCQHKKIRMVYVSPRYHYPTTITMSLKKRAELIEMAQEFDFIIIEDDFDAEFQYNGTVLPSLTQQDPSGRVIYVSSFGKSLAPGFRTGFIVAPENLIHELKKHLAILDRHGDILMEQALGEMIEEGVIQRHIKKSIKTYAHRRDLMEYYLKKQFGDHAQFSLPNGGLALWVNWLPEVNLSKWSQLCRQKKLFIPKNILYQNNHCCAIRMGFGHLNGQEIEESLTIMKTAWQHL